MSNPRFMAEVAQTTAPTTDADKPVAHAETDADATMMDAPNTPGGEGANEAVEEANANAWPPKAVTTSRGEILLTLSQSLKAPKGYAYMPVGDYAPFEANYMESKKRVRKPSAKMEGLVAEEGAMGIEFTAKGDDSAKIPEAPEKPDEELTEEERELRKVQRKEQKRRQKEELMKRLKEVEDAKTKVAGIEEKKKEEFASLPPPRPMSARSIRTTSPFDYNGRAYGGGSSKSKKSVLASGFKKMKDGRLITTARLQREYEVQQDRDARRKEMLRRCREVMTLTKKHKFHKIFLYPVDPVRQGIPDYPEIVKNPMDLSTVKRKLDERKYISPEEFCADMRLMFSNCALYNGAQSDAGIMGETVRQGFEAAWLNSQLEEYTEAENSIREQEDIEIRNTPATPLDQGAVAVQDARDELERIKREIEDLKRAKQEAMYKDDDFEDDEPVVRPKSRSRATGGSQKRQRDAYEDPDFDFDDARMDEDVYKEFKEESRARKEIKRAARAEVALPQREMSFDEKHELTMLLQELPEEKQGRVVQIVSESRKGMDQADDDEIEINIEELDSPTLWKLDKYVRGVLRPKKRKLNAAEQLLEAKMRAAQAARDLADVEDTLKQVQETGGSYQEVVNGGKPTPKPVAKPAAASDSDDSDSDSDTSSMDSAEGAGSNPEKRSAAAVNAANAPVDQSTNQFAKEAPGIKQNATTKAAVNVQNPSGWENLATSDTPAQAPSLTRQDAIPDDLWNEFEAAAQQKQQLDKSRQEDEAAAQAERERQEAEKKAAEEAAKAAEEAAKAAEIKAREEARAKAREELENQEQTIDLEAQREAMKQFGGDGMGGMMGNIDTTKLK